MARLLATETRIITLYAELVGEAKALESDTHLTTEAKLLHWSAEDTPGIKGVQALKDVPLVREHVDALVPAMEQHYEDTVKATIELPNDADHARKIAAEMAAGRLERAYAEFDEVKRFHLLMEDVAERDDDGARVLIGDYRRRIHARGDSVVDSVTPIALKYFPDLEKLNTEVGRVASVVGVLKQHVGRLETLARNYLQVGELSKVDIEKMLDKWGMSNYVVPGVPELRLPHSIDKR